MSHLLPRQGSDFILLFQLRPFSLRRRLCRVFFSPYLAIFEISQPQLFELYKLHFSSSRHHLIEHFAEYRNSVTQGNCTEHRYTEIYIEITVINFTHYFGSSFFNRNVGKKFVKSDQCDKFVNLYYYSVFKWEKQISKIRIFLLRGVCLCTSITDSMQLTRVRARPPRRNG